MKKLILSALTLAVIIMLSTPTPAEAKSKQYYQYTLKARWADLGDGKWGDHTFMYVSKSAKKKHGRLRTIKNYGCHNRPFFGNPWGGSERGRWLVRKSKSTKKAKDGALKVTHKWYCRMGYGTEGLCHQEANRVLYGARKAHAGFGRNIHGYLNGRTYSYYQYGRYGKGWWSCKIYAY